MRTYKVVQSTRLDAILDPGWGRQNFLWGQAPWLPAGAGADVACEELRDRLGQYCNVIDYIGIVFTRLLYCNAVLAGLPLHHCSKFCGLLSESSWNFVIAVTWHLLWQSCTGCQSCRESSSGCVSELLTPAADIPYTDILMSRTSLCRVHNASSGRAFSVAAAQAWNRLPIELRQLFLTPSFKYKLNSFLFELTSGNSHRTDDVMRPRSVCRFFFFFQSSSIRGFTARQMTAFRSFLSLVFLKMWSIVSPVHAVMLFIHHVFGLPLARFPGRVYVIISFSRLSCFLMVCSKWVSFFFFIASKRDLLTPAISSTHWFVRLAVHHT